MCYFKPINYEVEEIYMLQVKFSPQMAYLSQFFIDLYMAKCIETP